jgi:hypothetical protein
MADLATGVLAGGNIIGGLISGRASGQAASAQQAATEAAIAEQRRQFDISRADLAPWRTAGVNALGQLELLLGIGQTPDVQTAQAAVVEAQNRLAEVSRPQTATQPAQARFRRPFGKRGDVPEYDRRPIPIQQATQTPPDPQAIAQAQAQLDTARNALAQAQATAPGTSQQQIDALVKTPGYQFRLGEGEKAINRSTSATGNLLSGATLKGLTRYGQDYATNEYSNAYNRLAGLSGTGQTAATNIAGFGAQSSQNIADLYTQGGNARAAGIMGRGNALSGGIQDVAQFYALQDLLGRR